MSCSRMPHGIFSVKPLVGHCQSAAAAVETLATIYSFQTGFVPAPPQVAPGHPKLVNGRTPGVPGLVVKSSLGMGGLQHGHGHRRTRRLSAPCDSKAAPRVRSARRLWRLQRRSARYRSCRRQIGADQAKGRLSTSRYLRSMATASSFGERGSRVSFDRIELDEAALGERAFELSEGVELAENEFQSVTWVYDRRRDVVIWSSPSSSCSGSRRVSAASPCSETVDGPVGDQPGPRRRRGPIRHADLRHRRRHRRTAAGPDTGPHPPRRSPGRVRPPPGRPLPRRRRPQRGDPGLPHGRSRSDPSMIPTDERIRRLLRRGGRRHHRAAAVRTGARRAGRPLPATHRGLPRRGVRPPERAVRLRQPGHGPNDRSPRHRRGVRPGLRRVLRAPRSPISPTPPTSPAWPSAWPSSPSRGSSSSTVRSAFVLPRRRHQDDGDHQHPHHLGRRARLPGHRPRHVRTPGGRGRQPLPGQPGRPCLRRHHRYRRRRSHRELERGRPGHLRVEGGRGAGLSIGAVVTANRTDSAAVLERGQRTHRRKDGSEVDVLVSIDPLIDDDTQPSGWVVVCTELTDARQAEAGRRAAEERYEAVVASLSEGIVLFDEFGNVSAHNEAAARILGKRLATGSGHQIFTGSSIAIEANGHPLSAEMFPHAQTPDHRRVTGRRHRRGHRRYGQAPMAVAQLTAPFRRRPGRRADGGVLVHRRDRSQGGRSPAPLAGLSRLPHRARQPLPVQRRARARAAGVDAAGNQPGGAVHRPRPLQAGQRLLRPRQWRRGAVGTGPEVQVGRTRRRRGQPVLRATSSSCCAAMSTTSTSRSAWPPSTAGCCPSRSSSRPAATWWSPPVSGCRS